MPALHDFWRHLPTKLCGWWLDWWYPGCCCVAPSTWQSLCSVCPFSCRSCPSLSLLRYLMYPRLLKGQTKYGSSDPWSEPLLFRVRIYYFLSLLSDPPSTFIQCDSTFSGSWCWLISASPSASIYLAAAVVSSQHKSGDSDPLRQHNSYSGATKRQFPSVSTFVTSRTDFKTNHEV